MSDLDASSSEPEEPLESDSDLASSLAGPSDSQDPDTDIGNRKGKGKGKSKSTLLDGNHTYPQFYACYLLRSRASPNSQRTYVSLYSLFSSREEGGGEAELKGRSGLRPTRLGGSGSIMGNLRKAHGAPRDSGHG